MLQSKLGGVELILLDEVSIVGNNMFTMQINNCLKDIKGSKENFGGVSIIAIDDLFQGGNHLYLMVVFSTIFKILIIAYLSLIYGKDTSECMNFKKL
jgi:hypothetical protein